MTSTFFQQFNLNAAFNNVASATVTTLYNILNKKTSNIHV